MKLSVALCTYNGEAYLGEQLHSIRTQTRRPDELVVSDDQSGDQTIKLIERFASSCPFPVRFSVNEGNLGSVKNFEKVIGACQGDVIVLSDQDDVWHSDKLESIERVFLSAPDVGLVFSDAELVDADLKSTQERLFKRLGFTARKQRLVRSGGAFDILLRRTLVCGATMAFRSKFKDLVLPIPDRGPLIHDGWIALMIAAVVEVEFISQTLVKYRQHPAQQVGLAQVSTLEQVVCAQRTDREFYTAQAAQLSEALRRLIDYGIEEHNERMLREKIEHLNERARLPASQLRRIRSVGKEVVSLRYHRYSQGWLSAAKDLMH